MPETFLELTNLPESCSWTDVQSIFCEFGKINKIYLHPQREFAKVIYENPEVINEACQFVNKNRPLGMSGTSRTVSRPRVNEDHSSYSSNSSAVASNYKASNSDVDTSVNRNYVDVFGRIVTTLQDDDGDLYVSLKELKKSGFELFQVGTLPTRNGNRVYDALKISQFEVFMKTKAVEFMSQYKCSIPEEKLNNIIENEKADYFNMSQQASASNSLLNANSLQTPLQRRGGNQIKYNAERTTNNNTQQTDTTRFKREDGSFNKSTKTSFQNDDKSNQDNNNTGLRRPLPSPEVTASAKPLSETPAVLNKDQKEQSEKMTPKMFHSTPVASPAVNQSVTPESVTNKSASTQKISEKLPLRKLSIDSVGTGIFEFTTKTSENTFTAFALPESLSVEVCTLEEISNDCKTDPMFKPSVGNLVAAKASDGFVRALVLNHTNGLYKCALIDYGKIELLSEVRLLADKYISLPEFSFECKLSPSAIEDIQNCASGPLEIKPSGMVTFKSTSGKEYEAQGYRWDPFASVSSNTDKISSKPTNTESQVELKSTPLSSSSNTGTIPRKPIKNVLIDKLESTDQKSVQRGTVIEKISSNGIFDFVAATSNTTFLAFACPESYADDIGILDGISDDTKPDNSFIPKVGDLVAAETSDGFVRGLVLEVLQNKYKCALIDYGNTESVTHVRSLPEKYKTIPDFSFECEATPNSIQDLQTHKCTSFIISAPNVLTITLDNGKVHKMQGHQWNPLNVTPSSSLKITETVRETVPKSEKPIVKRKLVIEAISSSGIFEYVKGIDKNHFIAYSLLDSAADELCALEGLSDDCKYDPSYKPTLDDLVALESAEGFARGSIININNDEYTCALIDFGTIETTKKVYKISNKYIEMPEFAFVCKISDGSVDDFKDSKCVDVQIKTPKIINVTLDSGKKHVLHGSHWNPKELFSKPTENHVPKLEKTLSSSTPEPISKRKLVIDDVCETGVFEFVQRVNETIFVGFAFPCTFVKEVERLKDITESCVPDPSFKPIPKELVAVPNSDGLVRAFTVSDLGKGKYKCATVDYGLIATVDEVHRLPDTFKSIPEFAFECKTDPETLEILENTPCKSMEIKSRRTLTLTLDSGKVFEIKGYPWKSFSLLSSSIESSTPIAQKPKQAIFKGEPSGNVLQDKEQVIVVGVLDNLILVRNRQCNSLFKTVQQEVSNYSGDQFLEEPQVDYLATCNLKDDNSCRVIIRGINGSSASVEHIDYGDISSLPVKDLRTINDKLASIENTIIKIRLKNFPQSNFTPKVLEALMQINQKKEKFVAEKVPGETNVYELTGTDNVTLSSRLLDLTKSSRSSTPASNKREQLMKSFSLRKKSVCTLNDITKHNVELGSNKFLCLVTSYVSEGNVSFCKADEETGQLLEQVTSKISKYIEADTTPYEPELYEVCLAKFEDEWYRAAVIKVNEGKTYGVFYVDYGNSHIVTPKDVRKLPEELAKIRGIAILCSLEGVIKENEEIVREPLLTRLQEDIGEGQMYAVNVISCADNEYKITIPILLEKWKKAGLL